MTELIKNEIGDNKISKKIGEINWLESKIKDSYKEIVETKEELQGLKDDISKNLSGEKLKTILENELTADHVKNVLQQSITKFGGKSDMETFNSVYAEMGAGLVFNLQLALAKLGCHFSSGIDGMYGKDTTARVKEFQAAWNTSVGKEELTVDGWAGNGTLEKIVAALDDTSWSKDTIQPLTTEEPKEKKNSKKEKKKETEEEQPDAEPEEKEEETYEKVTIEQVQADPAKYHYHLEKDENDEDVLRIDEGYESVDADDDDNFATKKIATEEPEEEEEEEEEEEQPAEQEDKEEETYDKVTWAEVQKDPGKYHYHWETNAAGVKYLKGDDGYTAVDRRDPDNAALKKIESAKPAPKKKKEKKEKKAEEKQEEKNTEEPSEEWKETKQAKKVEQKKEPEYKEVSVDQLPAQLKWVKWYTFFTKGEKDKYYCQNNDTKEMLPVFLYLDDGYRKTNRAMVSHWRGQIYIGDLLDGKTNGKGTYKYSDGGETSGEFKAGLLEGKGKYTYPNGNVYEGIYLNDRENDPAATVTFGGKQLKTAWEKGILKTATIGGKPYSVDRKVDLEEINTVEKLFPKLPAPIIAIIKNALVKEPSAPTPAKPETQTAAPANTPANQPADQQKPAEPQAPAKKEAPKKEKENPDDKKYAEDVKYFESILSDSKYNPVEKAVLIEKRAQELFYTALDTKTYNYDLKKIPSADSKFAKLRDQAITEAVAAIKALSFKQPAALNDKFGINYEGYKKMGDNYQTLLAYKKSYDANPYAGRMWNDVNPALEQAFETHIANMINEAFYGTKINTKGFKLFRTDDENELHFQSYGYQTAIDTKNMKIKGLNIKFSDRNELIRVANLINNIRGNYKPEKIANTSFNISNGNIEQKADRIDDKILGNYDNFPTLKWTVNNDKKQMLVDYLNKNVGEAETKFMAKGKFAKTLEQSGVYLLKDMPYETTYKDYMNLLTAHKITRAIANIKKEGYVVNYPIVLSKENARGNYVKEGAETKGGAVAIDITSDQKKIESHLRSVFENPKKAAQEKADKAKAYKEKMINKLDLKSADGGKGTYYSREGYSGQYIIENGKVWYAKKGSNKRTDYTVDGKKWIQIKQ